MRSGTSYFANVLLEKDMMELSIVSGVGRDINERGCRYYGAIMGNVHYVYSVQYLSIIFH